MFTKTLKVLHRKQKLDVLLHLDVPKNPDYFMYSVQIRGMINDFFIGDEIGFTSQARAMDFIANYTPEMAKYFLTEQETQIG